MTDYSYSYPVTVEVFNSDISYSADWMPGNLKEAITWLQEKYSSIPEENKSSAKIEIGSETDYDSSRSTLKISYTRPSTEAEQTERRSQDVEQKKRNLEWAQRNLKEAEANIRKFSDV